MPGPGNYNLNNSAEGTIRQTFQQKKYQKLLLILHIIFTKIGPKWGFGTSIQRQDDTTKVHVGQPGPG